VRPPPPTNGAGVATHQPKNLSHSEAQSRHQIRHFSPPPSPPPPPPPPREPHPRTPDFSHPHENKLLCCGSFFHPGIKSLTRLCCAAGNGSIRSSSSLAAHPTSYYDVVCCSTQDEHIPAVTLTKRKNPRASPGGLLLS